MTSPLQGEGRRFKSGRAHHFFHPNIGFKRLHNSIGHGGNTKVYKLEYYMDGCYVHHGLAPECVSPGHGIFLLSLSGVFLFLLLFFRFFQNVDFTAYKGLLTRISYGWMICPLWASHRSVFPLLWDFPPSSLRCVLFPRPYGNPSGTEFQTRIKHEWARPDSNRRPSPCEGDVITTRPRARTCDRCHFLI